MKNFFKIIAILFFISIIGAVAAFFYLKQLLLPVSSTPFYKNVTIAHGSNVSDIAEILYKNELIKSQLVFYFMVKFTVDANTLKAGDYVLSSHLTLEEIIHKIVAGDTQNMSVTIPEGFTTDEIKKRLVSYNVLKAEEFSEAVSKPEFLKMAGFDADTVEGILFPDTYIFNKSAKAYDIIKAMVKGFKNKLPEGIPEYEKKIGLPFVKILIVASLVEKEARHDADRTKIASVFYNRLKKKMRLESCATIQYILGENRKTRLFKSDLQLDSPFNTYKHEGLPPAPICNPSKKSILAALNPEATDFLFFVARPNGYHVFSKTFIEHTNAIKEIRKNAPKNSSGRENDEI
ncbi:MAG TPA: endolytic transglycosylase MltG [Candidatus Wallbacteria bacterium]|nr:endolytic transglycosylase MltG [Candidatus Wallbacteria bacterium]